MKLIITDLADLKAADCRSRPVSGYRFAVMPYDFHIESDGQVCDGTAGQVVVVAPDGKLSAVSSETFGHYYQRAVERVAKPAVKPKSKAKPKAAAE